MPRYAYERLSAESASHLLIESARNFSHSATTLVFEPGPLQQDRGVDFAAIRHGIESRLHRAPRYRQRLKWIPWEDHPVWVDDREFNLDFHVRHSSLPHPGTGVQLNSTASRLIAQRLDRNRPLWECWVLEGLKEGRFALLLKTHNCMTESGDSGTELLQALLSKDPEERYAEPPVFRPRPLPSSLELLRDEVWRRAALPRQAVERFSRLIRESDGARHELRRRAEAVARVLGYTIQPARETPINGTLGPHRRFERITLELEPLLEVHRKTGARVNDVVLAVVAGALRRFLAERLVNPSTLDLRVAVPVSAASGGDDRVEEWVYDLPVWERDPLARLKLIAQQSTDLNDEHPGLAAATLFDAARWTGSRLLTLGARALSSYAPTNLSVVSLPGSPEPMYFMGARLLEAFPQIPLRGKQGLGVATMSYDGKLFFGLNGDFDLLPDLDRFRAALGDAAREIARVAGVGERKLHRVDDAG